MSDIGAPGTVSGSAESHPTPPLVGSSDTELLLPTEALLYVAARRDYATDLAAELLFQAGRQGTS
jgi:hypothetical protein